MNHNHFDLDEPILEISNNTIKTNFTVRNAVEGLQAFGGIGGGKTSGLKTVAINMLRKNLGGLVLTVKPDEKELWQEYCRLTNRENDFIVIEPGGKYHFDFIDYISRNSKTSFTESIVDILKTVLAAAKESNSGKSEDPFWEGAMDMLIYNTVDLCMLAHGKLSIRTLYDIVQSIPKPESDEDGEDENSATENVSNPFHEAFTIARNKVNSKAMDWMATLPSGVVDSYKKQGILDFEIENAVPEARLYNFVRQFFNETFINLNSKTRSIIDFYFTEFLYRLLREPIYSLFCRYESNITPEDCLDGKIILINLPVKLYNKVGRDVQILFKYIWQLAMEKRSIEENGRPVFQWVDESQELLHPKDADFQATARSSRVATVCITQNLPNYYSRMGGYKSDSRVKSYLGTLATKLFFANADVETNKYGSELIGEAYVIDETTNTTFGKDFTQGRGKSFKLERVVRPEDFNRLRTGSVINDYQVECYMHRQGNGPFHGLNHIKLSFNQNYIPS